MTILEGESLVNDATALVALRTALAAATGAFSLVDASDELRVRRARRDRSSDWSSGRSRGAVIARVDDTILAIVLTLLVPLGTYAARRARCSTSRGSSRS